MKILADELLDYLAEKYKEEKPNMDFGTYVNLYMEKEVAAV